MDWEWLLSMQYERGSDHSVYSVQGEWLLSVQCGLGVATECVV